MAPIFGFFGKVDTKVWYSLILLLLLVTHICVGAHVFKILETGFLLSLYGCLVFISVVYFKK